MGQKKLSLDTERVATLFIQKRPDKGLGESRPNDNGTEEDRKELSEESQQAHSQIPQEKTERPS